MGDRLLATTGEVVGEDAAHDDRFLLVDDSDRETAARPIVLPFDCKKQ